MTNDPNDLVPAQEKLEWVTPKISLMEAGDTDGNKIHDPIRELIKTCVQNCIGPS